MVILLHRGEIILKESSLQLVGKPKINSVSYETNKKFKFSNQELELKIDHHISVSKGSGEHSQEAIVVLNIGFFTIEEFETVPFRISMEIEGRFKWTDELEKDSANLEKVLTQNAPAILYTYSRPFITLITFEAEMPPLVIPLINFQD